MLSVFLLALLVVSGLGAAYYFSWSESEEPVPMDQADPSDWTEPR